MTTLPISECAGLAFPRRPGYFTGFCGHAVAGSEWRAGFRTCERCPRDDYEDEAGAEQ